MRSVRSIVLGVLSICGSLAAVVWLATSDVASAETVPAQTQTQVEETVSPKGVTVTKKKVVEKQETEAKPIKKKKKRIDFGTFEGY